MNVLAIIPARGGSKAIPRKNSRIIGHVPLIAHVIRACHASKRITHTIVSTDDEEIALIARRFGAEVMMRPAELAEDSVPLAPVVYHVIRDYESRGEKMDVVATVQPTSPLIRPETLDEGIELFNDKQINTVLSVYDNTHLSWTIDSNGNPIPAYEKRVNRQLLPRTLTETGGLIASRREVITEQERIGDKVALVELDPEEAVDIDTYYDWWLAEKIISRKKIVFNVIGSHSTGLGHVHRALTLARRLSDHHVVFIIPTEDKLAIDMVKASHFPMHEYEENPVSILKKLHPDIVVNDILDTDADLISQMREQGWRVVNFEDHGDGINHAHVVINALYPEPHPLDHVHTGADYYCLREEFFTISRRDVQEKVEQILLCFGGTDPSGLTLKTIRAINRLESGFRVVIILGPGFSNNRELEQQLQETSHPTEIVRDTKVISKYMEQSDLLVTSGGRTCYEAATIGIPALVMCQNERELKHLFASSDNGFINLGPGQSISEERLADELKNIVNDYQLRRNLQHRMWAWDGRRGIDRVLRLLVGTDSE